MWTQLPLEIQIQLGRSGLAEEREGGQGNLPFLPCIQWQSSRDLHLSGTNPGESPAWLSGQGATQWHWVPATAWEHN